jgi:beta-aspartyl-peptidase (threonine type)
MTTQSDFSLMLHGGAGTLDNIQTQEQHNLYQGHLFHILEQGRELLANGASALDVVTTCASLLEDDELFNAGTGSVLNENGKIEMDAAIMDGIDLRAGSVAEISNIKNPVRLARQILEQCEHVMLVGAGAMRFAEHFNIETAPDDYFLTEDRIQQWQEAHQKHRIGLDHDSPAYQESRHDDKYGTIGAIARDVHGNLAAATSTGGVVNKRYGRIGDSPIIGAGVYADNETCAVSCTGFGEDFMRTVLAKTASDLILFNRLDAAAAVEQAIHYLTRKLNGRGGLILIDKNGNCASGFTTRKMIRGWIEHGGKTVCMLEK